MTPVEVSATAENRIKGMIAIRNSVRTLIELQTEDYPDSEIKTEQERLNRLYTGIGRDTIYKLIKQDDCNFTLRVGKRTMIKRKRFEEYLEKLYSI